MKQLLSQSAVNAVRKLNGMAHTQQILMEGVHPRSLYAARDAGALTEISRGVFRLSELPVTDPDMLAVATRIPKAVFCLLTALHLHKLTQEIPRSIHIALPQGTHAARLHYPPLEVYFLSDFRMIGVEQRQLDGFTILLSSPARAVAEAFHFRRRVGLEAALDALKQTLQQGVATPVEIDQMAQYFRVQSVLRPYLEALT